MIILLCGLCAAVHYLWRSIKNLGAVLENQADNVVRPLVQRMLTAENTLDEFSDYAMTSLDQLQYHTRAMNEDINTLFRAARRGAPPHPDEPSSSRQRTSIDTRTPEREPEGHQVGYSTPRPQPEDESYLERDFLEQASREIPSWMKNHTIQRCCRKEPEIIVHR